MGLALWLYLTDFIGNIDGLCIFVIIIYIVLLPVIAIVEHDDDESKGLHCILRKWWIPVLAIFISVFIPAQRTMYLMLGASYLSQSKVPDKVSKVLDLKLDSIISDLTKDNAKKIVEQVKDEK